MKCWYLIILVVLFSCKISGQPDIPFEKYYYDEPLSIYGYKSDKLKNITISIQDSLGRTIDSVYLNAVITDTLHTDSLIYDKNNLFEFQIVHSPIKLYPKYNWKITIDQDIYLITDIIARVNPRRDMYSAYPIWQIEDYKVNGILKQHSRKIEFTIDERLDNALEN